MTRSETTFREYNLVNVFCCQVKFFKITNDVPGTTKILSQFLKVAVIFFPK